MATKLYDIIAIDRATLTGNSNKEINETFLLGIVLFCVKAICKLMSCLLTLKI